MERSYCAYLHDHHHAATDIEAKPQGATDSMSSVLDFASHAGFSGNCIPAHFYWLASGRTQFSRRGSNYSIAMSGAARSSVTVVVVK